MTLPTRVFVLPGDGELLPGTEIRSTIKITHEQTNGAFVAFEERTEPHAGPPVHSHTKQWEYFRVLDGEFEFLIGDSYFRGEAGTVVVVPPNTSHGFRNVADTDSTLEFLITPGHNADEYFRQLTNLLANDDPEPATLDALAQQFDLHIQGPPLHETRDDH